MELKDLATNPCFENPKMAKLEEVLLNQFASGMPSKGILFSKTRKSTRCLNDWVRQNRALQSAGVKPAVLTGAGNGIDNMTQVCGRSLATASCDFSSASGLYATLFSAVPFLERAGGHDPQLPQG